MKVKLTFFAGAQERVGSRSVELDFPQEPVTVAEIRSCLVEKYPALAPLAPHLHFAAGTDYLSTESQIANGAELVCFPPVSGG
ncbi:MAG: MoaD/ThiS family protein [Planctomycetaceae bacterium]|nr:MoaD/ThiS family protein [Planctomycetaceae bacterium]